MTNIVKLRKLDDKLTKNYPEVDYNGAINEYEDEMDYVEISLKGTIIA